MKNNKVVIPMIALGLILGLAGCNKPSSSSTKPTTSTIPSSSKEVSGFTIKAPYKNQEIDIANEKVRTYLNNYSKGCSSVVQGLGDVYQSKEVKLEWDFEGSTSYYTVKVGTKQDLSDATEYITLAKYISLKYLNINQTYYWQVFSESKNSEVYSFSTKDGIRTLDIDGVSNGRDIGGKTTLSGKKIKQGMVYRSAAFDDITEKGLEATKYDLKIKTDLDLRNPSITKSPLGDNVNFKKIAFPYWYDGEKGINQSANWSIIKDAIDVFADDRNYPIGFHCAIGQDRTGTLAILLESILGLDEESINIDYEMSSFSSVAGDAKDGSGNIIKIADKWTYQVSPTINYLKTFSGNNLAEKAVNYLKTKCGVTDDTIESIRDNLLED